MILAAVEEMDDSTLGRASEQPADSIKDSSSSTEKKAESSTGTTELGDAMTDSPSKASSSVKKQEVETMDGAPSSASFKQQKRTKWNP